MHQRSLIVDVACVLATLAACPRAAAGDESFTEFGFEAGGAGRLTSGVESGFDTEGVLYGHMLRFDRHRYRSYGIELSYGGNDSLEFFGIMGRVEVGLGGPRFNRRSPGKGAHAWATYFAVTAGFGSGTVWDTEYIELYGSDEEVEVAIEGIPAYAAIGVRRIGGFSMRLEAVAGAIIVRDEEADLPEGDAPSTIPSIGVRFAIGGDTFFYTWM